jgi:DNA-binding transcriptional LysR family regulator
MDLDLRKLRYFTAVAQHEHFGRAARQLHIAQPVLSRQIRALEQELGCALLVRTTRSVRLTPAGRQLYEDAPGVLAAAQAATRRVHGAARADRLVVGFAPGLSVSPAIRAFTRTHPDVEIELLHLNWYEKGEALRDGRADVGFLRHPFDTDGIHTIPVGSEPKVVCLPTTHPLASRRRLTLAALDGETILDFQARRTATVEEKLELVAVGQGIALLPRSIARSYSRPDLVHRPVTDVPPTEICLAVLEARRDGHVNAFLTTATHTLSEHHS